MPRDTTASALSKLKSTSIRQMLSNGSAKESYNKLCAFFNSPEEFESHLLSALLACWNVRPDWLDLTPELEMSRKKIGALPKRLKNMAGVIEKFNRHPPLRMDHWFDADGNISPDWVGLSMTGLATFPNGARVSDAAARPKTKKEQTIQDFERLPDILQLYADFIDESQKRLGRVFSKPHRSDRMAALCRLMQIIRIQTGNPMYPDLANVLSDVAAYVERSDRGLDADSLAKIWNRTGKKMFTTA